MDADAFLEQVQALAGTDNAEATLRWVQTIAAEYGRLRGVLASLSVVSVIMAGDDILGVQLPAHRQTPEGLAVVRDALVQSAAQLGQAARSAAVRKEPTA